MGIPQLRAKLDETEALTLDLWRAYSTAHCAGDWTDDEVCQQEINAMREMAVIAQAFLRHIADQRAILDQLTGV